MALIVKDRVKETTTTTGTGTVTLAGASAGFQSFAAIGNGNTTYYAITSGDDYEVGLGTYTASTLSRDTVLESSNSGSKITLSGTSEVFCTYPAEKAVIQDSDNTGIAPQMGATNGIFVNNQVIGTSYTLPTGYNAISASPVSLDTGVTVTVPASGRWVIV